jgi:hypothetical protein
MGHGNKSWGDRSINFKKRSESAIIHNSKKQQCQVKHDDIQIKIYGITLKVIIKKRGER